MDGIQCLQRVASQKEKEDDDDGENEKEIVGKNNVYIKTQSKR